jgi:hypothetical protein
MSCAPQARTCRRITVRCNRLLCAPATEPPQSRLFDPRWTVLRDLRRTKGTEHIEAADVDGLPMRQRRNAANDLNAGTPVLRATRAQCLEAARRACARRLRRGNGDSTEHSEAADARNLRKGSGARRPRIKRTLPRRQCRVNEGISTRAKLLDSMPRTLFKNRPHNAAVERPRDQLSSAPRVHNEMTHMRRARDAV